MSRHVPSRCLVPDCLSCEEIAEDLAEGWEPYDPYRAPIFGAEDEIWPRWAS